MPRPPAPDPVAVNDPAGAGVLADRLTAVLAQITGVPRGAARVLARQLLDGTTVAVDHAEQLRELWYRPAEEFVDGAYPALMGRAPAPASVRRGSRSWVVGVRRRALLAELLTSDDAQRRGLDREVLTDLERRLATEREQRVEAVRTAPPDELLRVIHLAVLGREPDAEQAAALAPHLASVDARRGVLAELLSSDEANGNGAASDATHWWRYNSRCGT